MKIVGLDGVKKEMHRITAQGEAYRKGGAKVPNIVVNISKENGQSYVADYITSVLYEHRLRKFCGLDMILEYRLDGTLKNVKQVFEDIAGNAVYTNAYEGVVAIDVSALSEYVNESQVDFFVNHITEVAQSATVIIYYNEALGKRMEIVKDRICKALGNYIAIHVEPYSVREYSEIAVQSIKERGIDIESEEELETILCHVVGGKHVSNAKEAVAVAEDLAFCADYSGFIPKIDIDKVNKFFSISEKIKY
jgi:hypothetical protein